VPSQILILESNNEIQDFEEALSFTILLRYTYNLTQTYTHYHTHVRLARTIYIRCVYGNFGREITQIYGHTRCIYMALAIPTHTYSYSDPLHDL